jgi:DNA-binding NarL/FixJ family response regulator
MSLSDEKDSDGSRSLLIAEPLELVREGFAAICEQRCGCQVVALCGDGETALAEMMRCRPDFAVLDLGLSRLFTLELVRKARAEGLNTKIIVLGVRFDRKTVYETLRAGASAYVLKSGPAAHLLEAFEQLQGGGVYISPLLNVEQIFVAAKKPDASDPLERLSSREYEVFTLLVEGIRAKEIAARLDLSPKTVDTYRSSLMRKLEIYDVAGLVKFAINKHLISVD